MNWSPRPACAIGASVWQWPYNPRFGHRFAVLSIATAASFTLVTPAFAAGSVTSSGDVSPPFAAAPVVDLTGQSVYLGFTTEGIGTQGTISVTGGGSLTAAQLAPGTGGLGIGIVTVTGPGSVIHLTGGGTFNGLDIGSWGTGTLTVSGGGLITCASPAACAFNEIGDGAGSNGTLSINGGTVSGLGSLSVGVGALQAGFGTPGANTTGTLSITNGGLLSTSGYSAVANNTGQTGQVTGNVTINGAGSSWTISRDLAGGGSQAALGLAPAANSVASVTISNGGNLTILGSRTDPATDNSFPSLSMSYAAGATSTLTVTTGGTVRFGGDTGALTVGGSSAASVGSTATLNITAGGTVAGTGLNGLTFVDVGQNQASGTLNIIGPGSQLVVAGVGGQNTQGLDGVGGLVEIGRNHGGGGGSGTLNISGGGSLLISDNGQAASTGVMGLQLANGAGSSGVATVSGIGSSIVISSTGGSATTPFVLIGNGGAGQMTISNGATVSILGSGERDFVVNNSNTGSGSLSVTGGSQIVASRFAVADNGGIGVATIDHSTINLDGVIFFNGSPIGAGVRVARGVGAVGLLNLQNGAAINIDNSISSASVILGGTTSLAGGTGTLNMSGGSTITFTGTAPSASLQVGGIGGTGFMSMTGNSVVNVGATGSLLVGATAGSSGTLTIGGGSSIIANNIGIGGDSDTSPGGTGRVVVTGSGSLLSASGDSAFLSVGRGGTGSLSVTNQGSVSATVINVGRATGGVGTISVDNGQLNLFGQQTTGSFSGATLSIGNLGGIGTATITNGSLVTISNAGSSGASLNVGGTPTNPLGTGALTVSDSKISVIAAPGLAAVRVGHDGNGTATFTNSVLNVGNPTASGADGMLTIAGQVGSTGVLSLNAGSIVNAGYVGIGATPAGPGGAGALVLNNSTINTTTMDIGPRGVLSGNGGVINATGDVTVEGTISPGNSPGRISINCNLITLMGSTLDLDILAAGTGFDVDHLRLGNDSTFSLGNLHIVFNFLGNTDPNAFAASGGFNLDNFLQSVNLTTGEVTGLSTVFAPGETWNDVVNAANISAVSSAFDISSLQLRSDGSFAVIAAPIPEPSTWAMLIVGMLFLSAITRRRLSTQQEDAHRAPRLRGSPICLTSRP
jgi:T5SS/PEP-CTERM-associated repeat protein